jgi:hypothetical protein
MKLTERQKNCPYCHPGIHRFKSFQTMGPWRGITTLQGGELELDEIKDDSNIENEDEACFGDISFNPSNKTLSSWADGAYPLIVHIQYCPFCGRKLRK